MADMITISKDELVNLEERIQKLAADKSHLQLIVHLMNKMSAVSGLDNVVENMLKTVGDVIGGVNLILYYLIDQHIYCIDINGVRKKLDSIDDGLVRKALETRGPIEIEHAFSDTRMTTPEFTKAYTWAIPLLVGPEIVGAFKLESLHIAMREMGWQLPTFFSYVALILKNEISSHSRLQKTCDDLKKEMTERQKAEEALRLANEALEERVAERTEELHKANERLRESENQIKALLEKSEQSRRALLSLLEDEKQVQETLRRLNRELRAISECNQVLMRAVDEQTLLDEICRIICEEAGYQMCWVGYAENDGAKTIRPAAWAGIDCGYIANAKLSWSQDSERGRGPAGIAIRSGEIVYVQDFATDALMEPWRECAMQRGYRSGIALPLNDENACVFGVLLIYSAEVNAITPDEIRFMGELADDLAFGVTALRTRAERKRADEALRRSEERKTLLNEIANIFLTIPDEEMYGNVLEIVLRATNSRFGIFGFLDENGDLILPSLTRDIWEQCQVPDKSLVFPPESWSGSLWGRAIREKKTFCSDGPFHTPEGHILIDHFLTAPIVFGQETIGLLSIANKEESYNQENMELLETIAAFISPILNARLQRDAQERKRMGAEAALRESEEKYRLLVENAEEAIFLVQDGKIEFPNRKTQELSGRSMQELTDMPFSNLLLSQERRDVLERIEKCVRGEKPAVAPPFKMINKSGGVVWVQLSLASIPWKNRSAALCFLNDVSEQKAIEAQLLQSQKMEAIGRLAGGVAHDFNNILTVINGYAELALMKLPQDDPLCGNLHEIFDAGIRASDLTRQLLAFSRKQSFEFDAIDLNDLIDNMTKMLIRLIGEDIELVTVPVDSVWRIKADLGQIEQIVMNLAVNARDAMPKGGKLTIETANVLLDEQYAKKHIEISPGPHVMLAVTDNGCGMDPATMDMIFDPFFTTKEFGKGTGLGLSTVYGIVKQSGGSIWVYSELQVGTTFKLYFPRSEEAPLEKGPNLQLSVQGAGETVLVVEDEDSVREIIVQILEFNGYKAISGGSGKEVLRLAEQFQDRIDLLITDIVMPEMDGRELAKRLTAIRPDLKTLYMSGYTDNAVAHNGLLTADYHFMQKPFSTEILLSKVREVLD